MEGLTVSQAIELLQKMPSDALLVSEAGEASVLGVRNIELGKAYKFTDKELYGMSNYLFCSLSEIHTSCPAQECVYIGI